MALRVVFEFNCSGRIVRRVGGTRQGEPESCQQPMGSPQSSHEASITKVLPAERRASLPRVSRSENFKGRCRRSRAQSSKSGHGRTESAQATAWAGLRIHVVIVSRSPFRFRIEPHSREPGWNWALIRQAPPVDFIENFRYASFCQPHVRGAKAHRNWPGKRRAVEPPGGYCLPARGCMRNW